MGTYFMARHILTQGRYKPIRSSFESRRKRGEAKQLNFEGFDMVCRANGFIDGFFVFVHVCMYRSTCMYLQVASQPASPYSYIREILVCGLFTTESVLYVIVNTTQRRTCIHAFQVVFQHATKCFNKLCLVCYLVSFFLSPSFSPLPARSIWRWLHLSVRS